MKKREPREVGQSRTSPAPELMTEVSFKQDSRVTVPIVPSQTSRFIKIFAHGELNAQGQDRRLLLRINGIQSGYQSFALMDGHAHMSEWDNSGCHVGRNGWGLDAAFSLEYTLSVFEKSQKVMGTGMSTFALSNNTILGYQCNGYVVQSSIASVDVIFTGGFATGTARAYLY